MGLFFDDRKHEDALRRVEELRRELDDLRANEPEDDGDSPAWEYWEEMEADLSDELRDAENDLNGF